jgi:hypothetical protein
MIPAAARRIEAKRTAYEEDNERAGRSEKEARRCEDKEHIERSFDAADRALDTLQSGANQNNTSQNVGGGLLGFCAIFGNSSVAAIIGPIAAIGNAVVGFALQGLAGKGLGYAVGELIEAHADADAVPLNRESAMESVEMKADERRGDDASQDVDDARRALDGIDRFLAQLRAGDRASRPQ